VTSVVGQKEVKPARKAQSLYLTDLQ